ncbi:hypothetical protein [uncultured Parasutterella sp.]|jgi:hypothetical protein|uniref:hypothetical protein n=1 Tax=uncultured Parasutterella sp. TaxID=1263098 RepID=UPI00206305BC|nr:hypothetical protein [uncultured Parasutterella sp.]DAJ56227.1 MAG TPA: hypothetical protein [Caudoviricetes sp.]
MNEKIKLKWEERSDQGFTTLYLYDKDGRRYEIGHIEGYHPAETGSGKSQYVFWPVTKLCEVFESPDYYWNLSSTSGVKGVMKEVYGQAIVNLWKILKEIKDEKVSDTTS